MNHGPEQKRLTDRLFNDPRRKLVNFHIDRGDGPATAEEICAEVNKAMDQVEERRRAQPIVGDVLPPDGESLIPKAARIICGHDFVQRLDEVEQTTFEIFIREVLTDLTTNRL